MRICRLLPLAALVFTSYSPARAQSSSVQFGPKIGLNLSVLDGQINSSAEFKPGLMGGAFLRWRASERIAIQPELVLSRQGARNKLSFGGMPAENKINLTYLNVPVLLKIYLGNVVNLQLGPQLGLLLGAQRVGQSGYYSNGGASGYTTEDVDVSSTYKSDVAVCGGLGVDLANGFLASVRLNYGFTNIDNDEKSMATRQFLNIGGLHNRSIEFSVGYAISGH